MRGRADLVLAPDDDGPGAVALVRAEGGDLFGYGAREAVVRAVRGRRRATARPFGSAGARRRARRRCSRELLGVAAYVGDDDGGLVTCGCPTRARPPLAGVVAFAHGWSVDDPGGGPDLRIRQATP